MHQQMDTIPDPLRAIIPLELAQPGDEQVVVHSRVGKEMMDAISLDSLVDLPGVASVVADQKVMARRPLPQLHEQFVLNLAGTVDQATLSNLPGLVSLSLGPAFVTRPVKLEDTASYEYGSDKLDLNVFRGMPGLRDLRFNALIARSIIISPPIGKSNGQ